jgi:hypothetical protein
VTAAPGDDAPHVAGADAAWSEVWQLDASAADATGLTVRLECFPNRRLAWFWTYLVLPDLDGPIVVRDHEVPIPRQGLEVRAEGLWAELWCETPLEHWTYGLEAFAVRLDDPADALTGEIGERLPVGLDLEWETDGTGTHDIEDPARRGFVVPGIVHGEVLLGPERFELDAHGFHRREWGVHVDAPGAWTVGCVAPALTLWAGSDGGGFLRAGDGPAGAVRTARREAHAGAARIVLDGAIEVDVEVRCGAPVPIAADRVLDRALCRFSVGEDAAYGWSSAVFER